MWNKKNLLIATGTVLSLFAISFLCMLTPYFIFVVIAIILLLILFAQIKLNKESKAEDVEFVKKYGDEKYAVFSAKKININEFDNVPSADFLKIITNNQINNFNCLEKNASLINILNYLIEQATEHDENFVVFLDWKDNLEEIIYTTNKVLKKLNYDIQISEKQITCNDNEYIKNRRADNIRTTAYDLNAINTVLKSHNYEFIDFTDMGDCFVLAIVPVNKVDEITKSLSNN